MTSTDRGDTRLLGAAPELLSFLDYWKNLPRRCGLPSRCDFDPSAVTRLLPIISIVEPVDDRFRIRLIGTEMVARFGQNPTRKYADEFAEGAFLEFFVELFSRVRDERRPMLSQTRYGFHRWKDATITRLSVPFSNDGLHVDQIMTIAAFSWPLSIEPCLLYHDDRHGPHRHHIECLEDDGHSLSSQSLAQRPLPLS